MFLKSKFLYNKVEKYAKKARVKRRRLKIQKPLATVGSQGFLDGV